MLASQTGLCSMDLFSCLQRFAAVCCLSLQDSILWLFWVWKEQEQITTKKWGKNCPETLISVYQSTRRYVCPKQLRIIHVTVGHVSASHCHFPVLLTAWQYAISHAPVLLTAWQYAISHAPLLLTAWQSAISHTPAEVSLRSYSSGLLFSYRRFGTTYRPPLKMRPAGQ
jgi:hypothetical protein